MNPGLSWNLVAKCARCFSIAWDKTAFRASLGISLFIMLVCAGTAPAQTVSAQTVSAQTATQPRSQPAATALIQKVIDNLANGPAFYASVRESVFASKRDVVGVGTYEQAGMGTGQYHLQLTMHDGEGKHSLVQISDGRLAWTRREIAGQISLGRVDVARLNEWIPASSQTYGLSPSLLVGGWTEMLAKIERECSLRIRSAKLAGTPVVVISATLNPDQRERILKDSGRTSWPELHPTRIQIAIATQDDPETGFGKGLPIRWEFRSDPAQTVADDGTTKVSNGHLITLIELHSIRQIDPPASEQFRFDNRDAEVNFVNDTDHYLNLYNVKITQSERRTLMR